MIHSCSICGHAFAAHSWSGQCAGDKVFGPIVCHCPGWRPPGRCAGAYSWARSRVSCSYLRFALLQQLALCPACAGIFEPEAGHNG